MHCGIFKWSSPGRQLRSMSFNFSQVHRRWGIRMDIRLRTVYISPNRIPSETRMCAGANDYTVSLSPVCFFSYTYGNPNLFWTGTRTRERTTWIWLWIFLRDRLFYMCPAKPQPQRVAEAPQPTPASEAEAAASAAKDANANKWITEAGCPSQQMSQRLRCHRASPTDAGAALVLSAGSLSFGGALMALWSHHDVSEEAAKLQAGLCRP